MQLSSNCSVTPRTYQATAQQLPQFVSTSNFLAPARQLQSSFLEPARHLPNRFSAVHPTSVQAGTHSPTEPYQVLETLLGFRNPIRFVTTLPGSCNPSNPRHRGAQAPLMDLAVSGCPQGPPTTLAKIPETEGLELGSTAPQPESLTVEL